MHRTKRSACDRCRDQKLRCRRENGTATCIRCLRAGVSCETGSSKPLGRTPRRPLYAYPGHSCLATSDFASLNTLPVLDMSLPNYNSSIDLLPDSWDSAVATMQASDSGMALEEIAPFGEPISASKNLLPESFYQPTVNPTDTYALAIQDAVERAPTEENDWSLPKLIEPSTDPILSLSKLNSELHEWIALMKLPHCRPPWRMAIGDAIGKSNRSAEHSDSNNSKGPANPVGSFLQTTSKFINALKQLTSLNTIENLDNDALTCPKESTETTPAVTPLHNMSTFLTIMTSHLLFLRVYDGLFSRFRFLLENMPNEVANIQYDPPIHIGGFPLPQGNLQLKVILEVLEHQLMQVEILMGLPPIYTAHPPPPSTSGLPRPPLQRHKTSGLLDYDKYQSLLEVVVTDIFGHKDTGKGNGSMQSDALNEAVVRLRQNIVRVKGLLHT